MAFGYLTDTLPMTAIALDCFMVQCQQRLEANVLAVVAGAPHAGAHSFDDQTTFEFCDGSA